jgi:hypothetical protein
LSEWYANGPLGVEQGFSVPRAPAGGHAGPLTLAMAFSGVAHASLAANGASVLFSHRGGPSLRYGGLAASDGRGRALPSWLELHGRQVLLRVDVRGARYPLRIDPVLQPGKLEQQAKLTGTGESGGAQLGFSVALSASGNTAIVGGPEDGGGAGAAWVFTRTGSTWTQQGEKLRGGEESGNGHFASAVRLSSDGNTALIGGANDGGGAGAAWVFTRTGSTWTQQGPKLTGTGESGGAHFGSSVALSGDGNTALIGGPEDSSFAGAAWMFTRTGTSWSQQGAKLTGGAEEMGLGDFGYSVALSSDGSTALIGAATDGGSIANGFVGASWVFARTGSTWSQQGPKLTSGANGEGGEPLGAFGSSVALSADGDTALIGAFGEGRFSGAAWAFSRSGKTWIRPGTKLTGVGETGAAYFGYGVALSSDGSHALVGGLEDNAKAGAAWAFTRSGPTWTQEKLTATPPSTGAGFGYSVALSSDGATALIGGPEDSSKVGAAWAFLNPAVATNEELTGSTQNRGGSGLNAIAKPIITRASQSRRRWREVEKVARISRAQALLFMAAAKASSSPFTHTSRRGKYRVFYYSGLTGHEYSKPTRGGVGPRRNIIMVIPAGTTFAFTLNVQAAVSFAFTQNVSGHRLGGKCVAPTRGLGAEPACTRTVTRGTLSFAGNAGRNTVSFQGRIPGSGRLPPGDYTLVITASNSAGRSSPKRLRFTILG